MPLRPWLVALLILALSPAVRADGARMTVHELTTLLAKADHAHPVQLPGRDLSHLDLSGLDFQGANLSGANLYGVNLTDADLSGTDLAQAMLDHSTITRTRFVNANMADASLFMVAAYSTLVPQAVEAPTFAGADLRHAHIAAQLSRADFKGANLSGARIGLERYDNTARLVRTELSAADFTGATLAGANFRGVRLDFARLGGADLSDCVLIDADLSRADLSGAELAGADLTGADLDGTILRGARNSAAAKGFDRARHADTVVGLVR